MDEQDWGWDLPTCGLLELDYVTYGVKFEAIYELNLALPQDRAICCKLIERARAEKGENFVRPLFDGCPVSLDELERGTWKVPYEGTFTCGFVCAEPQHVATRHYCLDLSDNHERQLALALRQWAIAEPGENWMNEMLDGKRIRFDEDNDVIEKRQDLRWCRGAYSYLTSLPEDGILEFDYVVVRPRSGLPISQPNISRLDLSKPSDQAVASTLRQLSYKSSGDEWIDSLLSHAEWQDRSLKMKGQPLIAHLADEDFHMLQNVLSRTTNDFDRLNTLRTAFRDGLQFPTHQAIQIVKLMEYPNETAMCIKELWPHLADPGCLEELLKLLPSSTICSEELRLEFAASRTASSDSNWHITDDWPNEWTDDSHKQPPSCSRSKEASPRTREDAEDVHVNLHVQDPEDDEFVASASTSRLHSGEANAPQPRARFMPPPSQQEAQAKLGKQVQIDKMQTLMPRICHYNR